MGQKTLDFSVSKCFLRPPFNTASSICEEQAVYQSNRNCSKLASRDSEWTKEERTKSSIPAFSSTAPNPTGSSSSVVAVSVRFTTEELLRWSGRFTKAKIAARKQQDLRKEVLLHNAFLRAQTDLKQKQEERQKRWKELKPLFHLETASLGHFSAGINRPISTVETAKMAAMDDKMADDNNKMADDYAIAEGRQPIQAQHMAVDEEMEIERPSTPLPSAGAVKRSRCGCSPFSHCGCGKDSGRLTKKYRPLVEDDEDLKSLDRFLASLHFNWQRCDYDYQTCPP